MLLQQAGAQPAVQLMAAAPARQSCTGWGPCHGKRVGQHTPREQKQRERGKKGRREYLQQKTEKFHLFSSPEAPKNRQERETDRWREEKRVKRPEYCSPLEKHTESHSSSSGGGAHR